MKVLMLGSDRKLFEEGSDARKRIARYAALGEEIHIIVFALKKHNLKEQKIADNVWIYPTTARTRIGALQSAYILGKKILSNDKGKWVLSSQDPFEAGGVIKLLSRNFGFPYQVQLHVDIFTPEFKKRSLLNRIRLGMAYSVFRRATQVRVVSDALKRKLLASKYRVREDEIIVLPIHTELQKFLNGQVSTKVRAECKGLSPLVLVLSRLEPEKNIEGVIDAFAIAQKNVPTLGLLIVGEGSSKGSIIARIKEKGVARNVRFAPWTDRVEDFYASADIFVLNSYFEGFGRTILEAGASRCPVISTRVGIAESFTDGEEILLCDVGDTACVSRQILRLSKDPQLQKTLSVHMRSKIIERFGISFDEYVAQYRKSLEVML